MAFGACLLPLVQQTQGVKAAIEQGQRVIGRGVDQLFGQLHFIAAIAIKRAADQHVAGQFHLADHAHLRKTSVAMLIAGRVVARPIFRGIRCSPDHTVDAQQTQACPSWVIHGLMPTFLSQMEDLSDSLAAQPLTGLNHSAGCHQRTLARQHDVHATDHIPCRHASKERHGNHAPEHHFQRQTPLAQGRHTGLFKGLLDQRRIE
ncbi:hypothetical protein PS664_04133 [Pseudomonas fluorescens]|nr:hypothetical protein PS664_03104 [Pseudomonas fluorescens]VVN17588.1 hypothetical protein PS664_04133 [Pseudomonas fluorescens]